jgi:hypothetical protein
VIWCCSRPQTVQWLAQWTKSAPKARSHILAIQDDNLNMQMCIEKNYFIGKFEKESYFASYYRTKQMFIILNWSIKWDLRRKIKKNYNSSNIFKEKKNRGSVGWAYVAHLSFCFKETLFWTFHICFLSKCCSFGYSDSEGKIF